MNCPLYGYHALDELKILASSHGNQCPILGAFRNAYSPCGMEVAGQAPDWAACLLNRGEALERVFPGYRRVDFGRRPQEREAADATE